MRRNGTFWTSSEPDKWSLSDDARNAAAQLEQTRHRESRARLWRHPSLLWARDLSNPCHEKSWVVSASGGIRSSTPAQSGARAQYCRYRHRPSVHRGTLWDLGGCHKSCLRDQKPPLLLCSSNPDSQGHCTEREGTRRIVQGPRD